MSGKILKTGCLPSELAKPANTAIIVNAVQGVVDAGDAATLAAANQHADAAVAGGATPTGAAGGALTGAYPSPGLSVSAVVDAVESGIAADAGAQAAIANAIADNIVGTTAFQSAVGAAAPNLKTCANAPMPAGANVPTCDEMTTAIAAGVASATIPAATDATQGKVALNTGASFPADTINATDAVTAAGLNNMLNSAAVFGGNALQKAVVNAMEQALPVDAGAQAAIAAAIVDELGAAPGFAASVQAAETTSTLALVSGNYVYTNEDAGQTTIQPANFLSSAPGQSLSTGPDGKLFVNVIGMLPSNATYSGSTSGNVDISIVQDVTDPTLYTIGGNLDVAAQTPTNGTNLLKSSAPGFYVSAEEIASAIAATPAAVTVVVGAIPDASTTVKGKVELATTAETEAGVSTALAVTPAGAKAAIDAAVNAAFSSPTPAQTQAMAAAIANDPTALATLLTAMSAFGN